MNDYYVLTEVKADKALTCRETGRDIDIGDICVKDIESGEFYSCVSALAQKYFMLENSATRIGKEVVLWLKK